MKLCLLLPRNSRKTERGASKFLIRLVARAAPFALICGLICASSPSLLASGIDASATFTDSLISPGENRYDLTLNNTGTTTIGTFWFSWIPGDNFMPVSPTSIDSPAGWQQMITNGGPSGGFAIQWTADTPANDLAAGSSLGGLSF
jgi:hypothetical protein